MRQHRKFSLVSISAALALLAPGAAFAQAPTVLTPWAKPKAYDAAVYDLKPYSFPLSVQRDEFDRAYSMGVNPLVASGQDGSYQQVNYVTPVSDGRADECVYAGFLKLPKAWDLMPECKTRQIFIDGSI